MAQLVRAPPCHGGGRGFKSLWGRFPVLNHGILAQLGEHLPYKQRVTGSSPVGPILQRFLQADVAQLAEQLICNQQVIGSSPIIGYLLHKMICFDNVAGWSSLEARRAHNPEVGGSNPSPATTCPDSSVGRAED